jgi:pimeloyl-ACP methyl ester carboxylesterase
MTSGETQRGLESVTMAATKNLLFLPGLNCTAALFEPQVKALSSSYDCKVGDHGGHDRLEDIVADILKKSPNRFSVIGLSMGGYLALEIMRQQPERVESIVLLDTRATPDTEEDAERRRRTIEIVERGQFDALHAIFWPRLVHHYRMSDVGLELIVKSMMHETGAERFVRQQTALLNRVDYLPVLSQITIPVFLGVGHQDLITPPDMAIAMSREIPHAKLTIFDDCGHLSTLEQPELVTNSIRDFLNEENL